MPVTLSFGPVVAHNVACLLALPISAWTAYLLCRRITKAFGASLFGGYIFGFSTYQLGQLLGGHLDLIITFVIPLCALLVLLRFEGAIRPMTFAMLLGLALVFQFLFATEVFATMSVLGILSLLAVYLFSSSETRRRVAAMIPLIGGAYALAALALAPYLYEMFAPGIPLMPTLSPDSYVSHLHNLVLPTHLTYLRPSWPNAVAGRYVPRSVVEEGAYLGLPLIPVIVLFGLAFRHNAVGRFLVLGVLTTCLLSLGPTLHVRGAAVPLPWALATRLPLVHFALPARLMAYAFLFAAIIVATWLQFAGRREWMKWVLVSFAVLALVPNFTLPGWVSSQDTPSFFASGHYTQYIRKGEVILLIAPGRGGRAMLWQAQTRMYFRMTFGYVGGAEFAEDQRWPITKVFWYGTLVPDYRNQLKAYLVAHGVRTIVVVKNTPSPWSQLFSSFRITPTSVDDVILYRGL